jgi:hypothetical protein
MRPFSSIPHDSNFGNARLVQVRTARTAGMNGDWPFAYCFRPQRPVSASQTQSVNNRFKSGKSRSPLTKKSKRWQSSSPGHLPFHTCRRASLGSKCKHPSTCQPQSARKDHDEFSSLQRKGEDDDQVTSPDHLTAFDIAARRWRSPIGAPQSGQHGLSCLLMLRLRPHQRHAEWPRSCFGGLRHGSGLSPALSRNTTMS